MVLVDQRQPHPALQRITAVPWWINSVSSLPRALADGSVDIDLQIARLDDPDADLRRIGADLLGQQGSGAERALDKLRHVLATDDNDVVRFVALEAVLAITGGSAADIDLLIDLLDDSNPFVRAEAARSLGEQGSEAERALDKLQFVLATDEFIGARDAARKAVLAIAGDSADIVEQTTQKAAQIDPKGVPELQSDAAIAGIADLITASQCLASGELCWAVGRSGTILSSGDGGATWTPQTSGTELDLWSVRFQLDGQIGWISSKWEDASSRPLILQTLDGGETWETLSYRHLPAPWALYLALPGLILAAYGVTATYRPAHPPPSEEGIAATGRTDRPIGWSDPDVLGLKEVALGVSRFLRNTRTEPPLTIAVTGRWGTGKSSLMNLITQDLRRYGTRPVWFNAWHHQKEEHLLAALLENIRGQAVPPLWRMSGIIFRVRLVIRRVWRSFVSLLVVAMAIIATWFAARALFADFTLSAALDALPWVEGQKEEEVAKEIGEFLTDLLGVGAVGTIVLALINMLARLRLNPARLMSTLSDKTRVKQFKEQLSFGYRFAREFDDLCDVLRYGTNPGLVIMIDDLDRCDSDNVREVLEAVNFLVTAGRCFIFLGIDEEKVVSSVAQGFRDSILDLPDMVEDEEKEKATNGLGNSVEELKPDARKLAEFANNYLEKLINMSVPVPRATVAGSAALFGADKPSEENHWPERIRRAIRAAPDVAGPAVILVALSTVIFLANPIFTVQSPATAQAPTVVDTATADTDSPPSDDGTSTETQVQLTNDKVPVLGPDDLGPNLLGRLAVPFAALGLLSGLFLLRRSSAKTTGQIVDSAHFDAALTIWHPVIFATNPTPRGVKRHHNRLRFHAMRVRPREELPDWIDDMFAATVTTKDKAEGEAEAITDSVVGKDAAAEMSEEKIVALGAIEALDPSLLDLPVKKIKAAFVNRAKAVWAKTNGGEDVRTATGAPRLSSADYEDARFPKPWEAIDRFADTFKGEWPPTPEELERFRTLTRSVRA